jgi:hypothetical protein
MISFQYFYGVVTNIDHAWMGYSGRKGCFKLVTVEDQNRNIVNFVVTPATYFVYQEMIEVGDMVVGFYDGNAPALLIYPPQYEALVMALASEDYMVKVDYFDQNLLSSDKNLQLNLSRSTPIILQNGQIYTESPANHYLVVVYSITTRSIPPQTTPLEIVVLCY